MNLNFAGISTDITNIQATTDLAVRYVAIEGIVVVNGVDPADTNWVAVDVTAQTSANTYAVNLQCFVASATTALRNLYLRPTGSSTAQAVGNIACSNMLVSATSSGVNSYAVKVNTSQSFDWSVNNADVSAVFIVVIGYWETI